MAKTSMVNRELKRTQTVKKYAAKRAELKQQMVDQGASEQMRQDARRKFEALPRDASPVRGLIAAASPVAHAVSTASSVSDAASCARQPCSATSRVWLRRVGNEEH